jgi:leader peptidase (prepilin peptidase)/N-methyltransferase
MFFFIFGLFWGSFINNISYRIVRKESFLGGRSKCPLCHSKLKWYELIPVLSFVLQKGRCNYCKKNISLRYPISEIITGFFYDYETLYIEEKFIYFSILFWIFFVFVFYFFNIEISKIDIDNKFNYLFYIPGLTLKDFVLNRLYFSLIYTLIFLTIFILTLGKGIGLGDVRWAF